MMVPWLLPPIICKIWHVPTCKMKAAAPFLALGKLARCLTSFVAMLYAIAESSSSPDAFRPPSKITSSIHNGKWSG